jgi:hypothetical protein
MAAPNIVNVSTITGKSNGAVMAISANTILTNPASSNKVLKVNTLMISNIDGSAAVNANIDFYDSSSTTTYSIGSTISIPADSTVIIIDKNSSMYLEEGDYINVSADVNGDAEAIVSYEELS